MLFRCPTYRWPPLFCVLILAVEIQTGMMLELYNHGIVLLKDKSQSLDFAIFNWTDRIVFPLKSLEVLRK